MKNLFICLILVSFFFGCGENSEQENNDSNIFESADAENNDSEIPDITSAIVFMDNFKAENGGYGQMFHRGEMIGAGFYFWNKDNNINTCNSNFLEPEPFLSYMQVEGLMGVKVTINGSEKGEYKIVRHAESDFYETDKKLATVRSCVWHEEELQQGFEDCYVPYSGTVTVDRDVPPTVKKSEGIEINVKIDADFPEESLRLVDCEGEGEIIDGEYVESEICNCRADDGTNSQCTPSYQGERCCYNPDSEMVNYKLNLDTSVCHFYCVFTTDSLSDAEKCEP